MKRFVLVLTAGLLLAPAPITRVTAAEVPVVSSGAEQSRPVRHHYRRAEPRPYVGCPDGYSCYPLYGAYGPYGGQEYWAAYTGRYR
jgi:hypothetical protein